MELDALKDIWNESNKKELTNSEPSLVEMLQRKSYGPLTLLKQNLGRQLLFAPVAILILIYDVMKKPELLSNVFFWLLVGVCAMITIYFLVNYLAILTIEDKAGSIKQSLTNQLSIIEKTFKIYQLSLLIVLIVLPVIIEWLIYSGRVQDLGGWEAVTLYLRIPVYVLAFIFLRFINKQVFNSNYGQHLQKVKALIKQLD